MDADDLRTLGRASRVSEILPTKNERQRVHAVNLGETLREEPGFHIYNPGVLEPAAGTARNTT